MRKVEPGGASEVMPNLSSDDPDVPSAMTLDFAAPVDSQGRWLPYRLDLRSGPRSAQLADREGEIGRCWLALEPKDELGALVRSLGDLVEGRSARLRFEPSEPNFSLEIERAPEGYIVVCWLDAGNQISDHFTWDALGVRFFTGEAHLAEFRTALAAAREAAVALANPSHLQGKENR